MSRQSDEVLQPEDCFNIIGLAHRPKFPLRIEGGIARQDDVGLIAGRQIRYEVPVLVFLLVASIEREFVQRCVECYAFH